MIHRFDDYFTIFILKIYTLKNNAIDYDSHLFDESRLRD